MAPTSRSSVARNALSNYATMGVGFLWGLFLTPFVLRTIGLESYGVWLVVSGLIGYLGLAEMGFSMALIRYLPRYLAREDTGALQQTVSTMTAIYTVLAGAMVLAGVLLSQHVDFFKVEPGQLGGASNAILIMLLNLAVGLVLAPLHAAVRAMERFDICNGAHVLSQALRATATIALLPRYPTIEVLCLVAAGSGVLSRAWVAWWATRHLPRPLLSVRAVRAEVARRLVTFTWWTLTANVAARLIYYTDSLVIGKFKGMAPTSHYYGAWRLIEFLRQLSIAIAVVLTPRASRQHAAGDMEGVRNTLVMGARVSYVIALAGGTVLLLYGREILSYWLGPDFGGSFPYLLILLAPQFVVIANHTGVQLHYALGKHRSYAILCVLMGGANLALSVWLVQRMGLAGVAWGTTIPMVAFSVLANTWLVCANTGTPLPHYLATVFVKPTLATLPAFGLCWWLRSQVGVESLYGLLGQCIVAGALVSLVALLSYGRTTAGQLYAGLRRALPAADPVTADTDERQQD